MANDALARLAQRPRPTTVGGVIARLEVIEEDVPATGGVAAFNRLYRWTTEQVAAGVEGGRFEDPQGMGDLDVVFANLYFDAVDAWAQGRQPPGAWRPLFERSDDPGIPMLQFALAGMHAHINRDLAVALATSSPGHLREDSPQFRDFEAINTVLDQTSDQIRDRILPPALVAADHALGEVDDRLVMAAIMTARRAAWEVARRLHEVAGVAPMYIAALEILDTSVGATARAILDPAGVLGA